MLEKLKELGQSARALFWYVVTPVLMVAALIWFLLTKNRNLEDELVFKEGDEKLNELKGKQEKVDSDAAAALDDYERIKKEYLKNENN